MPKADAQPELTQLVQEFHLLFSQPNLADSVKKDAAASVRKEPRKAAIYLAALKIERERYTDANSTVMQNIIDVLVDAEIYPKTTPTMQKHGYSHLTMVESWGVDWHTWKAEVLNCPHCNADLRDLENGPPFMRSIGVEIRGLYDGVAYNQCPDCKGNWSRKGTPLSKDQAQNISRDEIFTI